MPFYGSEMCSLQNKKHINKIYRLFRHPESNYITAASEPKLHVILL